MSTQPLLFYQKTPLSQRPRRRICDLPPSERPIYRLNQHGVTALSNTELLALAIGGRESLDLAEELLVKFGSIHKLARASEAQLTRTVGIGQAQAARVKAIFALSQRLQEPSGETPTRVCSPADAAWLLMPTLRHLEQEELWIILLDTRNQVMKTLPIYKGSLNTSMVRIGEVLRPAVEAPAAAVIVAHNHPSGLPDPSPEDVKVTQELVKAGQLLSIEVLDHLIIGDGRFVSLKERGIAFE